VSNLQIYILSTVNNFDQAPLTPDVSSDKCIGFGMAPATAYQGLRITAASAYLREKPDNLTIKTNSQVARVIFEVKKAVGVELSDKTRCSSLNMWQSIRS
jgi:choline dehydrogenase-like flavoprotein